MRRGRAVMAVRISGPRLLALEDLDQLCAFVRLSCEQLGAASQAGQSVPPGLLAEAERVRRLFDPVQVRDRWARGPCGDWVTVEGMPDKVAARYAARHGTRCPLVIP